MDCSESLMMQATSRRALLLGGLAMWLQHGTHAGDPGATPTERATASDSTACSDSNRVSRAAASSRAAVA